MNGMKEIRVMLDGIETTISIETIQSIIGQLHSQSTVIFVNGIPMERRFAMAMLEDLGVYSN